MASLPVLLPSLRFLLRPLASTQVERLDMGAHLLPHMGLGRRLMDQEYPHMDLRLVEAPMGEEAPTAVPVPMEVQAQVHMVLGLQELMDPLPATAQVVLLRLMEQQEALMDLVAPPMVAQVAPQPMGLGLGLGLPPMGEPGEVHMEAAQLDMVQDPVQHMGPEVRHTDQVAPPMGRQVPLMVLDLVLPPMDPDHLHMAQLLAEGHRHMVRGLRHMVQQQVQLLPPMDLELPHMAQPRLARVVGLVLGMEVLVEEETYVFLLQMLLLSMMILRIPRSQIWCPKV